jgi:hypothetical protein
MLSPSPMARVPYVLLLAALLVGTSDCSAIAPTSARGDDGGSADPATDSGSPSSGGDDGGGAEEVGDEAADRGPGPIGKEAGPVRTDAGDAAPISPDACAARVPTMHRAQAQACPTGAAPATDAGVTIMPAAPMACSKDADCTDAGGNAPGTGLVCFQGLCSYDQCATDQDCMNGGVCICRGNTFWGSWGHPSSNSCVPANCRSDADCGPGAWCAPTVNLACGRFYGVQGYYCHTCDDACTDDSDCPAHDTGPAGYCAYDTTVGHWVCGYGFCAG